MNAPYGETQCQYKVELHTELETDLHWEGQWFTQHKKHPRMELKVQVLHEETHCALRHKEAQIQTASGKKHAKRQSGEKRTSQGRLISMLCGNALERRPSNPPSRSARGSRPRRSLHLGRPRWKDVV